MNTTSSTQPRNILLVDDDPEVRESIRLLLSLDRHSVTEAANGHQALQLFKQGGYDLVITDYLMPGMLGDELVRSIRDLQPAQPVLVVTAFIEKLLAAGLIDNAVLSKPFDSDELRRAIARSFPISESHEAAGSRSTFDFSRALSNRASATTGTLTEILRRKGPARYMNW